MRGDRARVICEQFIAFELRNHPSDRAAQERHKLLPADPAIVRNRGDYRESWQPAAMSAAALAKAQDMAAKVVAALQGGGRGWGLYGVEFFVARYRDGTEEVIFSELSPRPHDTGDGNARLAGLERIRPARPRHPRAAGAAEYRRSPRRLCRDPLPTVTAMISPSKGWPKALALSPKVDVRIFGKPVTRPYRRMGVALARADTADAAVALAKTAAAKVRINLSLTSWGAAFAVFSGKPPPDCFGQDVRSWRACPACSARHPGTTAGIGVGQRQFDLRRT